MKAIVFPGQGSQFVGMGKSLFETSSVARAVFEEVDDAIDFSLSSLMFNGDPDSLRMTENVQPALMAVSVALFRYLVAQTGEEKPAHYVAGHSLGEYSALTAASAITVAQCARLLKARGAAMQKAVPLGEGGMVAILGLELDVVSSLALEIAEKTGVCEVANDNAPGQVVVSGARLAMEAIIERAKQAGAKRAIPLPVSAPFHCSMMRYARDVMSERIQDLTITAPIMPCYANVDTLPSDDPEIIRTKLVQQICAPVRWRESILKMHKDKVETFVEVGAGKVLTGLGKRIVRAAHHISIQEATDIENFVL